MSKQSNLKKAAYWYEALALKYPAEAASKSAVRRHDELVKEHSLMPPLHNDQAYLDAGIDLRKRKFFDAAIEQLTKVLNSKAATAEQSGRRLISVPELSTSKEFQLALESLDSLPRPPKSLAYNTSTLGSPQPKCWNAIEAERVYYQALKKGGSNQRNILVHSGCS